MNILVETNFNALLQIRQSDWLLSVHTTIYNEIDSLCVASPRFKLRENNDSVNSKSFMQCF